MTKNGTYSATTISALELRARPDDHRTMRSLFFTLALGILPSVGFAESDTAYKALRTFGKQSAGEKLLNRVVEVRGRNGVPQPEVWKVIASDPGARGGYVEAEVQRGKIISQRT